MCCALPLYRRHEPESEPCETRQSRLLRFSALFCCHFCKLWCVWNRLKSSPCLKVLYRLELPLLARPGTIGNDSNPNLFLDILYHLLPFTVALWKDLTPTRHCKHSKVLPACCCQLIRVAHVILHANPHSFTSTLPPWCPWLPRILRMLGFHFDARPREILHHRIAAPAQSLKRTQTSTVYINPIQCLDSTRYVYIHIFLLLTPSGPMPDQFFCQILQWSMFNVANHWSSRWWI